MSVIASASKTIKFHQWPEGVLVQSYLPKSRDGNIQSISWGKDGSWVVLVPDSGPTEIISIKDNVKLLQTIQDVYRPSCATFHTTTKKLIGIGTVCGQVMVYDIKGKNIKKRFPRVSSKICSLHYNSKDTHIAATCNNGEILLLSNLSNNIATIYKVPNSSTVSAANFHRTRRNLFAAASDIGIVATWDINSNNLLCNAQTHQAPVSSLSFSPLRSDLLVTGGLDRKFVFYDLSTKKHVMEMDVKNAVTALDFSCCGVYLGVGYQNGNITIYDTRMFSSALSTFAAHEGNGTRHLLFQKVLSTSGQNNSAFDITIEELPYMQADAGDRNSNNASVFDSLGIVGCDDSDLQSTEAGARKPSVDFVDSFMVAMGLDGSNHSGSKNDSNLVYRLSEDNRKLSEVSKSGNYYQHSSLGFTNHKISTPKYLDVEIPNSAESPIVASNQTFPCSFQAQGSNQPAVCTEELKTVIRDIVRQEVKTQMESLKSSFKAEFTDMLCQVRRYFLDLQMSVIKEFVNMETLLEKQNPTSTEFVCNDLLINQNNLLQQEIVTLKENVIERNDCRSRKY